jgi:hypothetical protein
MKYNKLTCYAVITRTDSDISVQFVSSDLLSAECVAENYQDTGVYSVEIRSIDIYTDYGVRVVKTLPKKDAQIKE